MGGGSSANVQSANRALPRGYDEWRDLGARGWGWANVLLLKLENDLDFDGPLYARAAGSRSAVSRARRCPCLARPSEKRCRQWVVAQ
jgi:hypothetical protein